MRFEELYVAQVRQSSLPKRVPQPSHGKLFLLETEHAATVISDPIGIERRERTARRVERYWLCDRCSLLLTLTFERGKGMITVPLPVRNTQCTLGASDADATSKERYRAERS